MADNKLNGLKISMAYQKEYGLQGENDNHSERILSWISVSRISRKTARG